MLGRWQLLPAYAGSVAIVIGLWSVGVALILLAIVLLITAPLPVIRGLLGKYSVGVVDFEAEVDGAKVIGRWLYPSQPHQSSALYVALPRAGLTSAFVGTATPPALRRFIPRWVLSHWNCVAIPAKRGAALAKPCESMPVVLFSHGLTGTREVSQSLGLTLAAAGALVVLVEHTDGSSTLARSLDGSSLPFDHSLYDLGKDPPTKEYVAARREQTERRAAELRRHLTLLRRIHGVAHSRAETYEESLFTAEARGAHFVGASPSSSSVRLDGIPAADTASLLTELGERLDLSRSVVAGHSFGGASALTFACEEEELPIGKPPIAVVALDPMVDWVPERVMARAGYGEHGSYGLQQPPLQRYEKTPPLAEVPLLLVWSEEWQRLGYFRQWSANLLERAGRVDPDSGSVSPTGKVSPTGRAQWLRRERSHACVVVGSGHQALCDVALLLPGRLNALLKNSLGGARSSELASRVNAVVLGWLRNQGLLLEGGETASTWYRGESLPLTRLPGIMRHRSAGTDARY